MLYRFLGGKTVPVEFVRHARPLDSGYNAGQPRCAVRFPEVDSHNIREGEVRVVLSRFLSEVR